MNSQLDSAIVKEAEEIINYINKIYACRDYEYFDNPTIRR